MVNQQRQSQQPVLVLAPLFWGTLVWPLSEICDDDLEIKYHLQVGPESGVRWQHIFNPDHWDAIPCKAHWSSESGVSLQVHDSQERLAKFALRSASRLTFADLVTLSVHVNCVERADKLSRYELLSALARHFSDESPSYVEEVLSCASTKPDLIDSKADAGMVQVILENMEADEKSSFQEIEKRSKKLLQETAQSKWRAIFEEKMQLQKASGWLESFFSSCLLVCLISLRTL